jgi:hypothetical protein
MVGQEETFKARSERLKADAVSAPAKTTAKSIAHNFDVAFDGPRVHPSD